MGLNDESNVCTTSLRPGARLMTRKIINNKIKNL